MIQVYESSCTNCQFHILQEVGTKRKYSNITCLPQSVVLCCVCVCIPHVSQCNTRQSRVFLLVGPLTLLLSHNNHRILLLQRISIFVTILMFYQSRKPFGFPHFKVKFYSFPLYKCHSRFIGECNWEYTRFTSKRMIIFTLNS